MSYYYINIPQPRLGKCLECGRVDEYLWGEYGSEEDCRHCSAAPIDIVER